MACQVGGDTRLVAFRVEIRGDGRRGRCVFGANGRPLGGAKRATRADERGAEGVHDAGVRSRECRRKRCRHAADFAAGEIDYTRVQSALEQVEAEAEILAAAF